MAILVVADHDNASLKPATLNAVAADADNPDYLFNLAGQTSLAWCWILRLCPIMTSRFIAWMSPALAIMAFWRHYYYALCLMVCCKNNLLIRDSACRKWAHC